MCIRAVGAQVREQEVPSANLVPGNLAITPPRGPSNLIFLNLLLRERERDRRLSHH